MLNENKKNLISIREDLEAFYNGEAYTCPECGTICEYEEIESEEGEIIYKTSCGCTCEEEPEQQSLLDYFNDVLDINYILNSNRELIGVRLLLTWGGPTIWLDTLHNELTLSWWNEFERLDLDNDICNSILEVFNEIYF